MRLRISLLCAASLVLLTGCADVRLDLADLGDGPGGASGGSQPDSGATTGTESGSDDFGPGRPAAWQWANPLPTGNHLFAVAGTSSNDVWVVGAVGTIIHFDGTRWEVAHQADSDTTFHDVVALAPDDVWVAGKHGTGSSILHYDGTVWNADYGVAEEKIQAIWGADSQNVYAITPSGDVYRYDGTQWYPIVPGPTGPLVDGSAYRGIWAAGPDDVWVFGQAGVCHRYDGAAWWWCGGTEQQDDVDLIAATASADGDLWFLANRRWTPPPDERMPALEFYRYEAETHTLEFEYAWPSCYFSSEDALPDSSRLWVGHASLVTMSDGVMVASTDRSDDCVFYFIDGTWYKAGNGGSEVKRDLWAAPDGTTWGVGDAGRIETLVEPLLDGYLAPQEEHWRDAVPALRVELGAASATATGLWAIAPAQGILGGGHAHRFLGGAWEEMPGGPYIHELHAVDDHRAVAASFELLDAKGPGYDDDISGARLWSLTGGTWTARGDFPGAMVTDLWARNSGDLWATANIYGDQNGGAILRGDGTSSWRDDTFPAGHVPYSLWGASGAVYVASCSAPQPLSLCEEVAIHRGDGSSWTELFRFTPKEPFKMFQTFPHERQPYAEIWASGPNDIWLSGRPGLRYDGVAWHAPSIGDYENTAFWGTGPNDVWILSSDDPASLTNSANVIRHWNGIGVETTIRVSPGLFGLAGVASDDVWAVGEGGATLHFTAQVADTPK